MLVPNPQSSNFNFSATVNSETVRGLAYTEEAQTLAVTFTSGLTYIYMNVPKKVAVELFSADSVGTYFNTEIKGYYKYLKVGTQDQVVTKSRPHTIPVEEPAPEIGMAQMHARPSRRRVK